MLCLLRQPLCKEPQVPAAQVGCCAARQGWPHLGTLLWWPPDPGSQSGAPTHTQRRPSQLGVSCEAPAASVCLSASPTPTATRCPGCFHLQLWTTLPLSKWKRAHRCLGVIFLSSCLPRPPEPAN